MLTSLDIKEPGLNVFPLGVERHDEIEIINNEGNQVCVISVFYKNGKS